MKKTGFWQVVTEKWARMKGNFFLTNFTGFLCGNGSFMSLSEVANWIVLLGRSLGEERDITFRVEIEGAFRMRLLFASSSLEV